MSLELTSEERMRMWPVLKRFCFHYIPTGVFMRARVEDFMVELCEARYEKSPEQWEEEMHDEVQRANDMAEKADDLQDDNYNLTKKVDELNGTIYNLEVNQLGEADKTIDNLIDKVQVAQQTIATLEAKVQTLIEGVGR